MNHRSQPLPFDWPQRRAFVPQGADQQGRQEPTIPVVVDRVREDYDSDDGEPLTGWEAVRFWAGVSAPAFGMAALMALLLWGFKP